MGAPRGWLGLPAREEAARALEKVESGTRLGHDRIGMKIRTDESADLSIRRSAQDGQSSHTDVAGVLVGMRPSSPIPPPASGRA